MHEASLVRGLLSQAERVLRAEGADPREAARLRVRMGPLSGVEPELVALAFERLAPGSPLASARLELRQTPLVARCRRCDATFEVEQFRFVCTGCGHERVDVIEGDGFVLESIELALAEPAAAVAEPRGLS